MNAEPGQLVAADDHLIPFREAPWAFWKPVLLRGTGFPVELPLRLAAPKAVAALDRAQAAAAAAVAARDSLLRQVNAHLDAIREGGSWATDPDRGFLLKAQRTLWQGRINRSVSQILERLPDSPVGQATAAAMAAEKEAEAQQAAYEAAFAEAVDAQSATLAELAADPRFEEAVIWQNRHVYARNFLSEDKAAGAGTHNHRQRRREDLIASYIQRYCLKNDTIGFFGPAGWGRMGEAPAAVTLRPGERLLSRRGVFLEDWGVEEIAAVIARDAEVRQWLKPRRLPTAMLRGRQLFLPNQPPQELEAPVAAVLQRADGSRIARDLADELAGTPDSGVADRDEVFSILADLVERKLIAWSFEVPIGPHAQQVVADAVEAIGDEAVRERCRNPLRQLDACRERIAAADGPAALNAAIANLEETFTKLTGRESTRKEGQTYGGRTLVFEDTVRDVELELGSDFRAELEQPLGLVLTSARWLLQGSAAHVRGLLGDLYRKASSEMGNAAVPCGLFWRYLEPFIFGKEQEQLRALLPQMQEKWRRILGFEEGERRVERSSAELRAAVEEAFAVEAGWEPWPLGRLHSPDLLIAAPDVESIEAGEHLFVLGELHVGKNTLNTWGFMALAPHREEIFRSMDLDTPESQVIPLPPRDNPRITTRTHKAHLSTKDFLIPPMDGSVIVPPERAVSFGDAVLMEEGGRLIVRAQGGRTAIDPLIFFGDFLLFHLANYFNLLGHGGYWPRITIDRLVVHRESWLFQAEELKFTEHTESSGRFAEARRWAEEKGLPRFLFLRTPKALKPLFVDMESPIFVDLFTKAVRDLQGGQGSWVALNEMLPTPEQSWLVDAAGNHYSSELRIICKDLQQ